MAFNSIPFLLFFIPFFVLYWFVFNKNLKSQNILLLLGSYAFYAWADWRFLFFLIGISALNYFLGIQIEKSGSPKRQRLFLLIGLIQGIGGLAFFKYFNFFVTSLNSAFHSLDIHESLPLLKIIVPLGISFFTFRTVSYLLDIDKGKLKASRDWIVFFNYVAFFPSLLSGPIDKAIMFLPQLEKNRVFSFESGKDGMRQILWGLFKKVVVANNCAGITTIIFSHYKDLSGSTLLFGAFLYTIQVYADFSGYSDMALGFARLIGFRITKNFDFPFFAQNIADFWRRWHISLTSWLTEYVFTPLSIAFRNYGKAGLIFAILINLTIVGIWHGAKWTNIFYGFVHGCYFIPLILLGTMNKKKKLTKGKLLPSFREALNMLGTFSLVMFTFIIFRSDSIHGAFEYYGKLFSSSLFSMPHLAFQKTTALIALSFITIMMVVEWFGKDQEFAIAELGNRWNKMLRWSMYYFMVLAIFYFSGAEQQFIYFQF